MRGLARLLRCERGANAIEYALVASLIAIAAGPGRPDAQQCLERSLTEPIAAIDRSAIK